MKTTLVCLAFPLLAGTNLPAQSEPEKPGRELPELIERHHRGRATDADLRKTLEERGRAELMLPGGDGHTLPPHMRQFNEEARLRRLLAIPDDAQLDREIWRWLLDGAGKLNARTWVLGMVVESLDESVRQELGLTEGNGLRVREVFAASPADRAGIRAKDIIVAVDGGVARSREDLLERVQSAGRSGNTVKLEWFRGKERLEALVKPDGPPRTAPPAGPAPGQSPLFKRMDEMARRLDVQQKELDDLRRELERLKEDLAK
jgi:hypothetical protein